ncbi:potassium-transporting ATPase subunit C [Hymenobacter fastidiosus]|uniref:potassium-transporting ATPase subunit C n=1 Tax=Hymenobacter fastidiosus TaxID=486264 RepID=UPI0031EBAA31
MRLPPGRGGGKLEQELAAVAARSVGRHGAAALFPGLDPHLSPAGAAGQVARVARARNLDAAKVQALVAAPTKHGLLAPDRVNVLRLNPALDAMSGR